MEQSHKPQPKKRSASRRAKLMLLFGTLAGCVLFAEVALRLTTDDTIGNPTVLGRVRLLPYTPDADDIERLKHPPSTSNTSSYIVPDDTLGWTIGPSRAARRYVSNAQGVRADADVVYTVDPPAGRLRIVTVGDSFTHGDEVANDQTWQRYLEARDDRYQVINLGVPGYGTDQAYLRWRKRRDEFRAHVVVLGIWPENICRNLNVNRFNLANNRVTLKPRFYFNADGELTLLEAAAADRDAKLAAVTDPDTSPLMEHDYWQAPFTQEWRFWYHSRLLRTISSVVAMQQLRTMRHELYDDVVPVGNDVTVEIARRFCDEVRQTGATPIIIVLPMDVLMHQYRENGSFPLVKRLREAGMEVIDAGPEMLRIAAERNVDIDRYVPPKSHFSPAGNELVAEILDAHLTELLPSP